MNEMESKLKEFLEEQTKQGKEHSRYYSWEYCYKFFKENGLKIIEMKNNLLDLACLNLATYLASWGMYRNSKLLDLDYKVHEHAITELIKNCGNLWKDDCNWDDLANAKKIIEKNYKKYNVSCTQTLITKILMGMFGCTPAYDRFFVSGLSKKTNITKTFNKDSYNALKELSKNLKPKTLLIDKNIPYPPMKLLDTYFWCIGYKN